MKFIYTILQRSVGCCFENCMTHINTRHEKNSVFQRKFDVNKPLNILIDAFKFDLMFELLSLVSNMPPQKSQSEFW
jgi:hypothetical protein